MLAITSEDIQGQASQLHKIEIMKAFNFRYHIDISL